MMGQRRIKADERPKQGRLEADTRPCKANPRPIRGRLEAIKKIKKGCSDSEQPSIVSTAYGKFFEPLIDFLIEIQSITGNRNSNEKLSTKRGNNHNL